MRICLLCNQIRGILRIRPGGGPTAEILTPAGDVNKQESQQEETDINCRSDHCPPVSTIPAGQRSATEMLC